MRYLPVPAFLLVLLLPVLVLAQDEPSTVVDLGPVIDTLVAFAVAALTALASYGVHYLRRKLGIELDDAARNALNNALYRGIEYAAGFAGGLIPRNIDARNALIAEASNYVIRSTPDALARFGITPERLRELIEARLGMMPHEDEPDGEPDVGDAAPGAA